MMPVALTMLLAADLAAPAWKPGVPLVRDGAQLTYDGQPYAAVGVNKHELLEQYLAQEITGGDQEATAARTAAKRSLGLLKEAGITVVRFRACPFWPTWLKRTFRSEDAAVRAASWAAFDEMLDDCDRSGIRVIPSLAWNVAVFPDLANESLHDLVANPDSRSRALLREWSEEVVGRYRSRDTVLFWELGNEWNLLADLRPMFADKGVLEGIDPPGAQALLGGPVVRDGRNNFSSDELAAFTRDLCRVIRSVDPSRLVGTGFSAPRPAAWHLWLGSLRRATAMDWTDDSPEQQADYLRLITPAGVGFICLHHDGEGRGALCLRSMATLKQAADSLATPVYLGETGLGPDVFGEPVYDQSPAVTSLQALLGAWREIGFPLALAWTWDEWGAPSHEPVLRPDTQPTVVEVLRAANEAAQAGEPRPPDADALTARLEEIAAQLAALRPPGK